MRFDIGELLEEGDSNDIEYSFIGDAKDGLRLKLPKLKLIQKDEEAKLDDSLQLQLQQLKISEKLPEFRSVRIPLLNITNSSFTESKVISQPKASLDEHVKISVPDTVSLAASLQKKIAELEIINKAQVQKVIAYKKKVAEEQQRKDLERKRVEQEEERRKEEERRRMERDREAQLNAEKKARELEEKRLAEEKKQALEREQRELRERKLQEQRRQNCITDFSALEALFLKYKVKIDAIKNDIVKPVNKDIALKKLLGAQKRKINPKFGQLTNSTQQLNSIVIELFALIDEVKPNALGYQWILNFIAKAVVSQAETEVRVKPGSAIPLAKLTLFLLCKYPELKELLIARFIKKCPFVIGYSCRIDTEEGRVRLGWKRSGDGKWEDETSYDERMGGIMTLYAVLSRLPLPSEFINTMEHPIPLSCSWKILSRTCNQPLDLLTNTHFVVLGSWWDAAAAQFLQCYGRQSAKLLRLIGADLTEKVADKKFVGAARLRILMEEWETTGTIKQFQEMIA